MIGESFLGNCTVILRGTGQILWAYMCKCVPCHMYYVDTISLSRNVFHDGHVFFWMQISSSPPTPRQYHSTVATGMVTPKRARAIFDFPYTKPGYATVGYDTVQRMWQNGTKRNTKDNDSTEDLISDPHTLGTPAVTTDCIDRPGKKRRESKDS